MGLFLLGLKYNCCECLLPEARGFLFQFLFQSFFFPTHINKFLLPYCCCMLCENSGVKCLIRFIQFSIDIAEFLLETLKSAQITMG